MSSNFWNLTGRKVTQKNTEKTNARNNGKREK
jgi:hypothetical protein